MPKYADTTEVSKCRKDFIFNVDIDELHFPSERSGTSKSVEHIIPESLGNTTLILEKGWVCDKCNNYIAVKIEQPLLESPFFKQYRHELNIGNKRGRIADRDGFLIDPDYAEAKFRKHRSGTSATEIPEDALKKVIQSKKRQIPSFTVTVMPPTESRDLSRFLGKVGIEGLVWEVSNKGHKEDHYNQSSLNAVKKYVRQAGKDEFWPYKTRSLYAADHMFKNSKDLFKIISGWEFIATRDNQLLFNSCFSSPNLLLICFAHISGQSMPGSPKINFVVRCLKAWSSTLV